MDLLMCYKSWCILRIAKKKKKTPESRRNLPQQVGVCDPEKKKKIEFHKRRSAHTKEKGRYTIREWVISVKEG